jgi:hypothetical protein
MDEDFKEKCPGESLSPKKSDKALFDFGQVIKKTNYYPQGKRLDGCPYTGEPEFVDEIKDRFGEKVIIEEIEKMGGDPDCLNWWTWAGINLTEALNPQKRKKVKK